MFSPDGQKIVSGSSDKTISIWDVHTSAHIGDPLTGHSKKVFSVAVSPDGKYIVSGSADCTLRLWDMETRTQAGDPWQGHTDDVNHVTFSPDGRHVVSGSDDGTLRLCRSLSLSLFRLRVKTCGEIFVH